MLQDLKAYLLGECPDVYNNAVEWIDKFAEEETKKYREAKRDGKLTFGKYRGYTVKELNLTDKGKDYLQWLITQQWVKDSKPHIIEEVTSLGVRPKQFKRTPLE